MAAAGRKKPIVEGRPGREVHGASDDHGAGKRAAVILCADDYDRALPKKPTLVDHLLSGPEWDDEFCEIVNPRDKTPGRDVDL